MKQFYTPKNLNTLLNKASEDFSSVTLFTDKIAAKDFSLLSMLNSINDDHDSEPDDSTMQFLFNYLKSFDVVDIKAKNKFILNKN